MDLPGGGALVLSDVGEPGLQCDGVGLAGHSRVTNLRIKLVLCEGLC